VIRLYSPVKLNKIKLQKLPSNLYFSSKPHVLDIEDFIETLKKYNIFDVVVLMTREEITDYYFYNLFSFYEKNNINFIHYPIEDLGIPKSLKSFDLVIHRIIDLLNKGRNVIIHCSGGVGRSGLVIVGVLMNILKKPPNVILDVIRDQKFIVETREQEIFLSNYYKMIKASTEQFKEQEDSEVVDLKKEILQIEQDIIKLRAQQLETDDPDEIEDIKRQIDDLNQQKQDISDKIVDIKERLYNKKLKKLKEEISLLQEARMIPTFPGHEIQGDVYDIWQNYKKAMEKRRPDSYLEYDKFEYYLETSASVYKYKNSYVIGQYDGNLFIPTHFSPAGLKEGIDIIKSMKKYDNIVFIVTKDLKDMLNKMGFKTLPVTIIRQFRGVDVEKSIVYSNIFYIAVERIWMQLLRLIQFVKAKFRKVTFNLVNKFKDRFDFEDDFIIDEKTLYDD